jgi:hypothetical protein
MTNINEDSEYLEVFTSMALKQLPLNFQMLRKIYETDSEEAIKQQLEKATIIYERVSHFHQTNCYSVKSFYKPVSNLI